MSHSNDGHRRPDYLSRGYNVFFLQFLKVQAEGDYADGLAKNVDRIARFAAGHKDELTVTVSPEFRSLGFHAALKSKKLPRFSEFAEKVTTKN